MRHRVAGVKLSRTTAHRRALFRNLVTALLEHEIIRTTDAKAKETRRWADRMITLGNRLGDAAHLSVVELVERKGAETEQASPKKKAPRRDRTKEKEAPPARRRAAGG